MILFEEKNFLTVSYVEGKNYVLFDWTNFAISLDQIKIAHEKALDTVMAHKACYIADTSKVSNVLRPEVIDWWTSVWVPKLIANKVRGIVTVLPSSAVANLSTKSWQKEMLGGIVTINVGSMADAEEAITTIPD